MSRRISTLKGKYSIAIDEILDSKYEAVQRVAEHLPQIEAVALADVAALITTINEAKDFTGITVMSSDTTYWDTATKTLHVATVQGPRGYVGDKGDTGKKGKDGKDGKAGAAVHHVSPTSTTNKLGDFSTPGEYDTYTLYGDANETSVLGYFTVRNGKDALSKEEIAYLYELNPDANRYTDATRAFVDVDTLLDTTAVTLPKAINETLADLLTEITVRTNEDTVTRENVGLTTNGHYTIHFTGNYIDTATTVHDATVKLDTALKAEADRATSAESSIQAELDSTQVGAGLSTAGSYNADIAADYISTATSLKDADTKLDASLHTVETNLSNEVSRATTAEGTLQSSIDAETTRATTAEALLQTNIDSEAIRATTTETDLQASIDSEVSRATTAESTLQTNIDSTKAYTDTNFLNKTTTAGQSVVGSVQFNSAVTVSGNLHVQGTTTTVESAVTEVTDNQITLNAGETGNGVTAGRSGVEVDRGILPTYEFMFDEVTDTFRVGEVNSTVPVAAREDIPVNAGIAYWDNTTATFKTTRDINVDSITVSGTVDGRGVSADGTKLDTIETGATGDQTATEIKAEYESNLNTNAYTDTEKGYVDATVPLVTTAQTSSTAVNELHSDAVALASNTTALQSELDTTQTGAGLGSTGTYTADITSNYASTAVSLKDADSKLDTAVKAVSDSVVAEIDRATIAEAGLQSSIDSVSGGASTSLLTETNRAIATETTLQGNIDGLSSDVSINYLSKTAVTAQSVSGAVTFSSGIGVQGSLTADSITVGTTVDGRDVSVDGTKLDSIEVGATTDQTPAQIKTAYESNTNTNAYTDAEKTLVGTAATLSTAATTLPTAINELKVELDTTQAGTGLSSSGGYAANTVANYVNTATNLADADNKLDSSLKTVSDTVATHTSNTTNPHNVTKTQVGLSNVDNTNDANKPISTATQTVLDTKASLGGSNLQAFKVADAVNADEAISKGQLDAFGGDDFKLLLLDATVVSGNQILLNSLRAENIKIQGVA